MPIKPFWTATTSTLTRKSITYNYIYNYIKLDFLVNERRIVKLNQNETKIFELLRACVKETKLPVTLRVAGGWVRDKVIILYPL